MEAKATTTANGKGDKTAKALKAATPTKATGMKANANAK